MAAEKVAGSSYLLEEILIRLPAKSLARSKLVSKHWLSRISNPQFLQLHSRRRPKKLPTGVFLTDRQSICGDANFVSFSDLNPTYQTIPSLGFLYDDIKPLVSDNFSEIKLLDSCNGLLLCLVTFKSLYCISKYCVCNPTTKKLRLLPPAPFSLPSVLNHDYLAFGPSLSLHYKVFCSQIFKKSHIYVYSSENNCWSTIASPFDLYSSREWFFLNGSMCCAQKSLRFDVYTEKIEQIPMPPTMWGNYTKNYLPLIGSRVYCTVTVREYQTEANLQVVEMRSDFSEWVPKYDANVSPLLSAFPEIVQDEFNNAVFYSFDAICVIEGVKEDELELVLGIPDKLILYNVKEKTTKELCGYGYGSDRVYQFIESLSDV